MGPNPIWLVSFIKRGSLDTDTHTGRSSREDEGRDGVIQQKPRIANDCQQTTEGWTRRGVRGRGQFRPREPQGSSASRQGRTDRSREQDRGGGLKRLWGYSQKIPSQSLQKEPTLLTPWRWTSGLQNWERVIFCCLSCPTVVLVTAALANEHRRRN